MKEYKTYKELERERAFSKYKCKYCKMYISSFELYYYKGFCKDCFLELGLDKKEGKK